MKRITLTDVIFYLILIAIVFMIVRPGGQAGAAMLAAASALAAVIATAEGQPAGSTGP